MPDNLKIQFKSNTGRVQKSNGRFLTRVPEMEEEVAERFADDLEQAIKQSVRNKFGRFEGDLHDNIEANRAGSTSGGARYKVTANAYSDDGVNYAAWHEFAQTSHTAYYESFGQPNRELIKWAKMKGIYDDTWKLEVTPVNQQEGSFMAPAVKKAIEKARRRMRSGRSAPATGLQEAFR